MNKLDNSGNIFAKNLREEELIKVMITYVTFNFFSIMFDIECNEKY